MQRRRSRSSRRASDLGVTSDRRILVDGDNADLDLALARTDAVCIGRVGDRVESDAQPRRPVADLSAGRRRVRADPDGEHQAVDAA